jgi:hypothetical protein
MLKTSWRISDTDKQNSHAFVHSPSLLPDDSAGWIARELWWTTQAFSPAGIITMALHAHISTGGEQEARWWPRFWHDMMIIRIIRRTECVPTEANTETSSVVWCQILKTSSSSSSASDLYWGDSGFNSRRTTDYTWFSSVLPVISRNTTLKYSKVHSAQWWTLNILQLMQHCFEPHSTKLQSRNSVPPTRQRKWHEHLRWWWRPAQSPKHWFLTQHRRGWSPDRILQRSFAVKVSSLNDMTIVSQGSGTSRDVAQEMQAGARCLSVRCTRPASTSNSPRFTLTAYRPEASPFQLYHLPLNITPFTQLLG